MAPKIPGSWNTVLKAETSKPYYQNLIQFLEEERRKTTVYPPEHEVYTALELTPYDKVSVLLLGQDPYHEEGQAHGLAFSVRPGVPKPPSLLNIFKELHEDTGLKIPEHGSLTQWARQGVLLLNAVLTVRAHQATSHKNKGWELFTDSIIAALSEKQDPVIFLLWGNYARQKKGLIDSGKHFILESAHPSPLSARRGFFGSRPFSRTNMLLRKAGRPEIDWQITSL
jgi:uracil-DNA glycosylase